MDVEISLIVPCTIQYFGPFDVELIKQFITALSLIPPVSYFVYFATPSMTKWSIWLLSIFLSLYNGSQYPTYDTYMYTRYL